MYHKDHISMDRDVWFERKVAALHEHERHYHDALEISVVLDNEIRYHLVHADYYGGPGDVFLFRPFEPHWNLARDPARPAEWIMILFPPAAVRSIPDGYKMLAPFYTVDRVSPLISANDPHARRIVQAARMAVAEETEGLPGWQAKQYMHFIDVMVSVYRYYLATVLERGAEAGEAEPGVIRAIEYGLTHFQEDVDMDAMIRLSGLGRSWFYKRFQQVAAVTPHEFISRLRLQHAVYLLQQSGKPITDIAFESGFHSLSHFNKAFKMSKGITPGEYRATITLSPSR